MAQPERFYKGWQGQQYFSRFSNPHLDVAGLYFRMNMARWIEPKHRVFDYGSGTGANLLALNVAEKACYDVSEIARACAARAGLIVYQDPIEVPKAYWNVVICHHVLEHVGAPLATLSFLHELLVPGGRLILTVPLENHARRLAAPDTDRDHHLYCWNPTTLRNLVTVADYSILEITCRSAAREDIFAPIARWSRRAFQLAVRSAGFLWRRGEMTCIACPRSSIEAA